MEETKQNSETKKPENPFAFAMCDEISFMQNGMTLRDYFAGLAQMPYNVVYDILEREHGTGKITVQMMADYIAKYKYIEADAMLKQRETENL